MIHLHGNYEGFRLASSKNKFLRMLTGRHDLPFYEDEHVDVQISFFDAFLKGEDRGGWTDGTRPPVDLILRKGNVGYNDPTAEKAFQRRYEHEWPLARTQYTKYYLTPDRGLSDSRLSMTYDRVSYGALGKIKDQKFVHFISDPLSAETEITGYIVAHLNVSVTSLPGGPAPSDLDLFLTLRHLGADGKEIFYTGITGEPVPLCKGWLRLSMRHVNKEHARHREWLPYRDYFARDVLPVIPGEIYPVDVEVWATNVVAAKGDRIVFEVSSGDTQGSGLFGHDTPER
jgi:predicted acyl esterase